MRVLQVHKTAHIPQLLTETFNKMGIRCEFVEDVRTIDLKEFDLIHGHYALNRSTIRAFRAARRHKLPFVLHHHGSDVRRVTADGMKRLSFPYSTISTYMRKRADKVLLSTPDLVDFSDGEYIPNPVDIERLRPMADIEKSPRTLICGKFLKGSPVLDFVKKDREYDCVNYGQEMDFPENVRMLPFVSHEKLPEFLNRYTEMIGTVEDLISMTRLEAMACGLRTFTNFPERYERYYDGLNLDRAENPREVIERYHHPEKIAKVLLGHYEDILRR